MESLAFTYNADNRITAIANGLDGTQSETLGYSALGQLTGVASTADNESYQYDADGNRTQQVVNGVTSSSHAQMIAKTTASLASLQQAGSILGLSCSHGRLAAAQDASSA